MRKTEFRAKATLELHAQSSSVEVRQSTYESLCEFDEVVELIRFIETMEKSWAVLPSRRAAIF